MTKKQKGFSLIELLIVVAIILIIAAIAIPNLLRARISANESSAVGSMRSINTAEVSYFTAYNNPALGIGYTNLATLGGANPCTPALASGCYIDEVLSGGTKSGYTFNIVAGATGFATSYSTTGNPQSNNVTGHRGFFSDESGVIRVNPGGPGATVTSSPI